MLNKTAISAIRALLFVAQQESGTPVSPRRVAEALGESPTYLAKVVRHLVKGGILRAEKGVKGGVKLDTPASQVTLLAVVEACQGTIVGDYCRSPRPETSFCSFHRAALELHGAITGVLSRWTLSDLLVAPQSPGEHDGGVACLMKRGNHSGAAAILTQLGGGAS
jgi:Rrf2 family transcriptional regulator, nitric oxide-sensitive transcriptional repressor